MITYQHLINKLWSSSIFAARNSFMLAIFWTWMMKDIEESQRWLNRDIFEPQGCLDKDGQRIGGRAKLAILRLLISPNRELLSPGHLRPVWANKAPKRYTILQIFWVMGKYVFWICVWFCRTLQKKYIYVLIAKLVALVSALLASLLLQIWSPSFCMELLAILYRGGKTAPAWCKSITNQRSLG